MRSHVPSRCSKAALSSFPMISVSLWFRVLAVHPFPTGIICIIGLISQVAEELWEVKDKTIRNLTKDNITIVNYNYVTQIYYYLSIRQRKKLTNAD
jgi:hypothetical protein